MCVTGVLQFFDQHLTSEFKVLSDRYEGQLCVVVLQLQEPVESFGSNEFFCCIHKLLRSFFEMDITMFKFHQADTVVEAIPEPMVRLFDDVVSLNPSDPFSVVVPCGMS